MPPEGPTIARPEPMVCHGMAEAIGYLESQVPDARKGLPEDVFLFVSRLTPLVNVDLLIRDPDGRVLLTWRDDPIFGSGCHVLGGCVRLGESFGDRIAAVARGELGVGIDFDPIPLGVFETVDESRSSRKYHVSLLFGCAMTAEPNAARYYDGEALSAGLWDWHLRCPASFIQPAYRDLIWEDVDNHR